jgi:hypothetical protein
MATAIWHDLLIIWLTCTVIPRPKRLLEQIKGISEQKATKILIEGKPLLDRSEYVMGSLTNDHLSISLKIGAYGLHYSH